MKYIKEYYDDNKGWIKEEISKEQAIFELGKYYKNEKELVEIPCYYRTMYGGIEVIE